MTVQYFVLIQVSVDTYRISGRGIHDKLAFDPVATFDICSFSVT